MLKRQRKGKHPIKTLLGDRLCRRFSGRKLSESYQWWNVLDGPHSTYPRTWSRSASKLGSEADADRISTKLASQWPPSEYPVHIQIVGGVAGEGISVRVWNSRGIKESEIVYPADYAECEDPITAVVIEEIKFIVTRLLMEGKLLKLIE